MKKNTALNPVQEKLFALQDAGYRDFIAKLIPTMDKERIIGVRTPALRALARELRGTPQAEQLLLSLPHQYHEENQLHGFLVEMERDFDRALHLTDAFLPYVDNWATCDTFRPKVFKKHPQAVYQQVLHWLKSPHVYTRRYAMGVLMANYMDEHFDPSYLDLVADHPSGEYYLDMMRAWYFATALTKRYEQALPYIQQRRMDRWTHTKAIQKAVESRQISDARKAELRSLRY